ncbi:hypothetical protein FB451DRAFT_1173080 [Mycena latifolia]|nr:hypothetical protein FB451DRAFT_1173080 [Mycena latifolia]
MRSVIASGWTPNEMCMKKAGQENNIIFITVAKWARGHRQPSQLTPLSYYRPGSEHEVLLSPSAFPQQSAGFKRWLNCEGRGDCREGMVTSALLSSTAMLRFLHATFTAFTSCPPGLLESARGPPFQWSPARIQQRAVQGHREMGCGSAGDDGGHWRAAARAACKNAKGEEKDENGKGGRGGGIRLQAPPFVLAHDVLVSLDPARILPSHVIIPVLPPLSFLPLLPAPRG